MIGESNPQVRLPKCKNTVRSLQRVKRVKLKPLQYMVKFVNIYIYIYIYIYRERERERERDRQTESML